MKEENLKNARRDLAKLPWLLMLGLTLNSPSDVWAHTNSIRFGGTTSANWRQTAISGTVLDASGEPVAGVTVTVKGGTQAASTDEKGEFSLSAKEGDVLVFMMLGYEQTEQTVSGTAPLSVTMKETADALEEVVVVGYGTQKKTNITSAVSQVDADEMHEGGVRSPMDLIRGKVSGLSVTRPGGNNNPNEDAKIQLRGATTLSTAGGANQPLVVIDGIPGGNLNLLQQDDIESISVLKDGSAAAIYGTRGNAGVILVTTKKGKSGAGTFDYNAYVSHDAVRKRPEMLTAQQFRDLKNDPNNPKGAAMDDLGGDEDYYDLLLDNNNLTHYHNLSASGGSEKTTYRVSGNYSNNQGISLFNSNSQYGGRVNINHTGLKDRLHLQTNLATNIRSQNFAGGNTGDFEQALQQNPTQPAYNPDGSLNVITGGTAYYNPVARLHQEKNVGERTLFSGDAKATLDIMEGLKGSVFGSVVRNDYSADEYRSRDSKSSIDDYQGGGYARKYAALTDVKTLEATLDYNRTIANDHHIDAILGYSYQISKYNRVEAINHGFLTDAFEENNLETGTDLAAGRASMKSLRNSNKLIAFFGRANYDYQGKYMASFILRREGSSRFGANHKWGNFPAVSLGWNIHQEDFMQDVTLFDQLKLRGGYGVTGNQEIDNYQSLATLGAGGQYLNDGIWFQTYGPNKNPNPDLRWEKKKETNIGVDFAMFNSRLTGTIDWYQRRTTDLLAKYQAQVPPLIEKEIYTNVGEIKNHGIELALSGLVYQRGDWEWSLNFTGSYQKNELASLSNDVYKASYLEFGSLPAPGSLGNAIRTIEGGALGSFYGKRFAGFTDEGLWQFYKADGSIGLATEMVEEDKTFIGNGVPKYMAALGTDVSYKNWDLSVFLRGKFAFDVLNTQDMYFANKVWLPNNILQSALTTYDELNDAPQFSDYYLEKGDFVKLDNVTVGYTFNLPASSALRKLRLYASGQNLATITGYSGLDPEQADAGLTTGIQGRGFYPQTRTFTFGVNVGF